MFNRRDFLSLFAAGVGGLLLPTPRRIYSFANELRVPGIELDTKWHKFEILSNGTTVRGFIDGRVVVEGSAHAGGVFFERDFDGSWRGKLGDPTFPLAAKQRPEIRCAGKSSDWGLRLERGDIRLDSLHRMSGGKMDLVSALARSESQEFAIRLGWGDPLKVFHAS